jgi:hypothetical protein
MAGARSYHVLLSRYDDSMSVDQAWQPQQPRNRRFCISKYAACNSVMETFAACCNQEIDRTGDSRAFNIRREKSSLHPRLAKLDSGKQFLRGKADIPNLMEPHLRSGNIGITLGSLGLHHH